MYATPSPTGPGTPPGVQPLTHQPLQQQAMQPPAAGVYGQPAAYQQPVTATGWAPVPAAPVVRQAATQLTGAYASSGDAGIDRMIAFEAACKRFGSLT